MTTRDEHIMKLERQVEAAKALALTVESVIKRQTSYTITVVGTELMKAQKQALDDFNKALK